MVEPRFRRFSVPPSRSLSPFPLSSLHFPLTRPPQPPTLGTPSRPRQAAWTLGALWCIPVRVTRFTLSEAITQPPSGRILSQITHGKQRLPPLPPCTTVARWRIPVQVTRFMLLEVI